MHPTQHLPEGYQAYFHLDLAHNRRLVIALNILAILLFFVFGYLFLLAAAAILAPQNYITSTSNVWWDTILILLAYLLILILHELVHGLFFWLFTRQKPRFGFKGTYAYASAPNWYIPKHLYAMVGIAPLVVLSLVGLLLLPILPPGGLLPWVVAMAGNAGGAVGDLLTVGWLLRQPADVLVQDHGDAITAYRPAIPS